MGWRWALRLIQRDERRKEKRGKDKREGEEEGQQSVLVNFSLLTQWLPPSARNYPSQKHTHTIRRACTHTSPPNCEKKKKELMIFQHVYTISRRPSLWFLQELVHMCKCVCLTLKMESVCVYLQVYYVGVCHVWGTICSPQICFHP